MWYNSRTKMCPPPPSRRADLASIFYFQAGLVLNRRWPWQPRMRGFSVHASFPVNLHSTSGEADGGPDDHTSKEPDPGLRGGEWCNFRMLTDMRKRRAACRLCRPMSGPFGTCRMGFASLRCARLGKVRVSGWRAAVGKLSACVV